MIENNINILKNRSILPSEEIKKAAYTLENVVANLFQDERNPGLGVSFMKQVSHFLKEEYDQEVFFLDYENKKVREYYLKSLKADPTPYKTGFEDHTFLRIETFK